MEAQDHFINYLERKQLSPKSIGEYTYYFKTFGDQFTQDNVNSFLDRFKSNIVARAFLINYKEYLTMKGDPVHQIIIPKVTGRKNRKLPNIISEDELRKIEQAFTHERNKLMLLLSFYCALRVTELTKIKPRDFEWVEWDKNRENVAKLKITGKGDRQRFVFVPSFVMKRMLEWGKKSNLDVAKPVWFIKNSRWSKLLSKASIKSIDRHVNPHLLRHSGSTWLYENGMVLEDVSKFLGHQNINTTLLYARISQKNLESKYSDILNKTNK